MRCRRMTYVMVCRDLTHYVYGMLIPIHLLIADDHPFVRQGLALLLSGDPDMRVVGEAINGHQVLVQLVELDVHVVLMDVRMPILDGIQTTERIARDFPEVKVLGLSLYEYPGYAEAMRSAGALGCLPKSVSGSVLREAIRTVAQGQRFVHYDC